MIDTEPGTLPRKRRMPYPYVLKCAEMDRITSVIRFGFYILESGNPLSRRISDLFL